VLGLALLGIVGTAVELVFLRHWGSEGQLIVWPAIIALTLAFVLVVKAPTRKRIRAARAIAVVVVLIAGIGMAFHVLENLKAGPLDRDYGPRWGQMSIVDQWTSAIIAEVGPAPTIAPGVLAEISLALLLVTLRHPATRTAND
jgi:hypothetical protein